MLDLWNAVWLTFSPFPILIVQLSQWSGLLGEQRCHWQPVEKWVNSGSGICCQPPTSVINNRVAGVNWWTLSPMSSPGLDRMMSNVVEQKCLLNKALARYLSERSLYPVSPPGSVFNCTHVICFCTDSYLNFSSCITCLRFMAFMKEFNMFRIICFKLKLCMAWYCPALTEMWHLWCWKQIINSI